MGHGVGYLLCDSFDPTSRLRAWFDRGCNAAVTLRQTTVLHGFQFQFAIEPCAGALSAVNAIGTHLRDPINLGRTRWRMAVS